MLGGVFKVASFLAKKLYLQDEAAIYHFSMSVILTILSYSPWIIKYGGHRLRHLTERLTLCMGSLPRQSSKHLYLISLLQLVSGGIS